MSKKYELYVSGYVIVQVEADSVEEAQTKALETTVAGDLYNFEFDSITEVEREYQ